MAVPSQLASRMFVPGDNELDAIYNSTEYLAHEIEILKGNFNNLELQYLVLSTRDGFHQKTLSGECTKLNAQLDQFIGQRQIQTKQISAQMAALQLAFNTLSPHIQEEEGDSRIQQIRKNLEARDGLDEIVMPDGCFDIDEWCSRPSWVDKCRAIGCVAITCFGALLCNRQRWGMTKIEKLQRDLQEGM